MGIERTRFSVHQDHTDRESLDELIADRLDELKALEGVTDAKYEMADRERPAGNYYDVQVYVNATEDFDVDELPRWSQELLGDL